MGLEHDLFLTILERYVKNGVGDIPSYPKARNRVSSVILSLCAGMRFRADV